MPVLGFRAASHLVLARSVKSTISAPEHFPIEIYGLPARVGIHAKASFPQVAASSLLLHVKNR